MEDVFFKLATRDDNVMGNLVYSALIGKKCNYII